MLPQLTVAAWVGLGAFASAALFVFQRLSLRHVQEQGGNAWKFLAIGFTSIAVLLGLIYVATWGFTLPRHLLPGFWTAVLLGAFTNFCIQGLGAYVSSYKVGEASYVGLYASMTPGMMIVLALTLRETPGIAGAIGIFVIIACSWVLTYKEKPQRWWEYLGPLYRLSLIINFRHLQGEERQRAIVVWLALLSAGIATFSQLFDALYARRGVDMQGFWLGIITIMSLLSLGYVIPYLRQRAEVKANSGSLRDPAFAGGLVGFVLCWIFAMWSTTPMYLQAYVAEVGALKRLSILFTVFLAWAILREGDMKRRVPIALLIAVGALLIASEELPARLTHQLELFGL
jgi:uncharacterized membrane protein